MLNTEFKNELLGALSNKKTGRFQLLGKFNGVNKGASIDIYEGEVVKVRLGNEAGLAAAMQITEMAVDRHVFMNSSSIDSTPEPNTPEADTLLNMITDADSVSSDKIISAIADALKPVMGSGSKKLVESIAEKCPPARDEKAFLTECREATTNMVGEKMADQVFDHFMDKNF